MGNMMIFKRAFFLLKYLGGDRTGNFGILTALLLFPLLGAAGAAIDLSQALEVKTFLNGAADATALGAISDKSSAVAQASALTGDGIITLSNDEAKSIFNAQLVGRWGQNSADITKMGITVQASLVKQNGVITSRITYAASVPTMFMEILGIDKISLGGLSTASYQIPTYLDFYLLLDNTPSMGVGATTADIAKLVAATASKSSDANCAFACHIVSTAGVEDTTDYYHIAKSIGATIRIDVVAQAVSSLMANAQTAQAVTGQFRMAVYTFGQAAQSTSLYQVVSSTTDLDAISKAAQNIQLMTIPSRSYAENQTDYNAMLTSINSKITSVGTGTSASDRQPIVFMVADGVGDASRSTCQRSYVSGTRCIEPLNTTYCDTIKARGIKIAVLYTTYLPLTSNSFYKTYVAPFITQVPTKMKSCASDGYYFEVSPSDGISEAMSALFKLIVDRLRLTS